MCARHAGASGTSGQGIPRSAHHSYAPRDVSGHLLNPVTRCDPPHKLAMETAPLLLPLGLSRLRACRKWRSSPPLSSMYPIGSDTRTSTRSGQLTSPTSPSRTQIRSDRPLLWTRVWVGQTGAAPDMGSPEVFTDPRNTGSSARVSGTINTLLHVQFPVSQVDALVAGAESSSVQPTPLFFKAAGTTTGSTGGPVPDHTQRVLALCLRDRHKYH